jgi:drug/metabolite transporter (DMT)-like permease
MSTGTGVVGGFEPGRGLAAALLAVLIWGIQLPIAKALFPALDGYSITVVRYGVAFVAFVPLLWWMEGVRAFTVTPRELAMLFVSGLAMGASALFMISGLALTRPEIAVLILSLQPAITVLIDWLVWKRRPPVFTVACIVLAFAGVTIAVTRGGDALFNPAPAIRGEVFGNLLTLLAAIAWVVYVLLTTRFHGWSAVRVSALTSGPATGLILGCWCVAWFVGFTYLEPELIVGASWRLAYVSLLGVVLAMFLWNAGARRIGAVNAMLLLNLMPVITFGFRAIEGADFMRSEVLGAGIVVGALVANNLYLRRARR